LLVIFDDHHPGTSMPSGDHPPHQLAASFILDRIAIFIEQRQRKSFIKSRMHAIKLLPPPDQCLDRVIDCGGHFTKIVSSFGAIRAQPIGPLPRPSGERRESRRCSGTGPLHG
jgi:hypothetical protein